MEYQLEGCQCQEVIHESISTNLSQSELNLF